MLTVATAFGIRRMATNALSVMDDVQHCFRIMRCLTEVEAPMSQQRFGVVSNRVTAFREEVESWKTDHDLAMKCMDFESLLQAGLSVLDAIHSIDERCALAVRSGQAIADDDIQEAITRLYEDWSVPCARVLQKLPEFEHAGYAVKYAPEIRAASREVAGILTKDADFFVGDAIVDLRDEAIDAHRENRLEHWQHA